MEEVKPESGFLSLLCVSLFQAACEFPGHLRVPKGIFWTVQTNPIFYTVLTHAGAHSSLAHAENIFKIDSLLWDAWMKVCILKNMKPCTKDTFNTSSKQSSSMKSIKTSGHLSQQCPQHRYWSWNILNHAEHNGHISIYATLPQTTLSVVNR